MKNKYVVFTGGIMLLCGVGFGYFLKSSAPVVADDVTKVKVQKATNTEEAMIKSLRRRVRELERKLAENERQAEKEEVVSEVAPAKIESEQKPPPNRGFGDFRNYFKDMAKNDPARFAQMTNRMARWNRRRQETTQNRLEVLESIDTSGMTDAEKENHNNLQDALLRREELHQEMQELQKAQLNASDEESEKLHKEIREIGRELHSLHGQIRELENEERNTLLNQTMTALGYSGDDAKVISETIRTIYKVTGENTRSPGHRPPPPGR